MTSHESFDPSSLKEIFFRNSKVIIIYLVLDPLYITGTYCDILNPAYIRYVNVNLGGLRFLSGLRTLIYIGEDEPPRRIVAWSCCADKDPSSIGCKIQSSEEQPKYHPGPYV